MKVVKLLSGPAIFRMDTASACYKLVADTEFLGYRAGAGTRKPHQATCSTPELFAELFPVP